MQVTLPSETAGELTLPSGLIVWVQTVNALHREQAAEAADLWASRAARTYRKGGEGYEDLTEQFEDGGIELQCGFLADQGYLDGSYAHEAETKFPGLNEPTRNDGETDDAFDKRVLAFDEAQAATGTKRAKHIEKLYEAAKKTAEGLTAPVRLERCCKAAYVRKRQAAFGSRFILEVLARGVRQAEDHARMVYPSADAVADLPDDVRQALITKYFETDPVRPAEVPI